MFGMLAFGAIIVVMFVWFAYGGISGRMMGKPWRFVLAATFLAVFGSITVGAIDMVIKLFYPGLVEVSKIVDDMITGVVYSFAGALFGAAVTVKSDILRKKDLKVFGGQKDWVEKINEWMKEAEGDEKLKFLEAYIHARDEMLEAARREGIAID